MDDLEFKRRAYNNNQAYRQSKQANRMLTAAFGRRMWPQGVAVNACHPGDVSSKLSNNLGFGGSDTPEQAADTPVWLATSPFGQEQTGQYFEHRRPVADRFVRDLEAVEALYQICRTFGRS